MSGTPNKRVHEDGGGHSRYSHMQDDSTTYSGMGPTNPKPSAPGDYHATAFDISQDARMPKVPRTEMDNNNTRRSPMLQIYRMQTNDDHTVEETRVGDSESKDLYQGGGGKSNDHSYPEYRNEAKTDKDGYWKEPKEHHRTWKYPGDGGKHVEIARESEESDENKLDVKGDDNNRIKGERDRKRKEGKHREWEKEEKDLSKDNKIIIRDKEKDHNNTNINTNTNSKWIVNEKEGGDSSQQKNNNNNNNNNKGESDDGGVDVEEEREREAFNYGVQQRKRMLRPRGSPQLPNPRFKSRSQDNNDGSTGKADVSSVVYRVGECMQELIKLWKEYESSDNYKMAETSQNGPTLEIRIPAEHVSATNRQVKGGQLWGTDIYTDDSDLVAVLMHTGYCRPTASPPPPAIQELRATVRVLPPQDCYISTLRNNVRSRAWGAAIGCSYRVERCYIVKKGGGTIDLEACLTHTSTVEPTLAPVVVERTMTTRAAASNALRQQRFVREVTLQYNLCNEPWIKYSISAIADKGLKKPLFTSARLKKGEVVYLESRTRRYELCYNGEKMENNNNTTITTNGNAETTVTVTTADVSNNNNNNNLMDVFRWSECKKALPQTVMRSIGIPLPPEHLQVLEENLDWEDIQWSQTGVWISGKEYPLSRVHFLSPPL